jgi:hypothetical protein
MRSVVSETISFSGVRPTSSVSSPDAARHRRAGGARPALQAALDVAHGEGQARCRSPTLSAARGDLDLGLRAVLAAQRGREQPDLPALAQVGRCSTPSSTPVRPSQRSSGWPRACSSVASWVRARKARLAATSLPEGSAEDHAVRELFTKARRIASQPPSGAAAAPATSGRSPAAAHRPRPGGREAHHEKGRLLLAEHRRRQQHLAAVAGQPGAQRVLAPDRTCGGQEVLQALAVAGLDEAGQRAADQLGARGCAQAARGRVGLQHLQRHAVHHEEGVAGSLEQVAEACLRLAEPPVVLFHGLLRFHQTLLERHHGTHVAPEGDDPCAARAAAVVGQADGRVQRSGCLHRQAPDA